ncbi:uncharacterized protein [Watersipora subatra]|uniref:uncharacterized protein n=1 Tax=Watersipora subatra TaxID=2589382 RepID=UPI00355B5DFD
MSVMLTATKHVVRKKSAARAKSACKKKPATKVKSGEPKVSASNVRTWTWSEVSDGDLGVPSTEMIHTLTFRKDTLEIWVNDVKAKVEDAFAQDAEGAVINFDCSLQKGSISTCRDEAGELVQVLTLETPDGPVVVE